MAKSPSSRHVVIIGGGLAGCTAALALARHAPSDGEGSSSIKITLVEAKSRLGGRVGSYTDAASGLTVDYCQHVGMNCCSALKQLIQWLDQASQWRVEKDLYFYGPGPGRQRLSALPWLPPPLHLTNWLLKWPGLSWRERTQIARGMLAINRVRLMPDAPHSLEGISADAWLRQHGQSPRALERFWSTIIVSALGEDLDRVGILPVVKVFQDGFLRKSDAYHLLIPQRPLSELFGQQMQAALTAAGVQVLLSTTASDIQWQGSLAERITLSNGETIHPDSVIVAVPWHAVGEVIGSCPDPSIQSAIANAAQLKSSPISGVHTWWDRPWLPTPHAVLVGRLCQWIFPHAEPQAAKSAADSTASSGQHYYQIVISASRMLPRGDQAAVTRLIEEDLREVFDEAKAAKLLRLRVVTDPDAVFSVGPNTTPLRRVNTLSGSVFWAGDWTNTGWPATMEGAIRSGLAAANMIQKRA